MDPDSDHLSSAIKEAQNDVSHKESYVGKVDGNDLLVFAKTSEDRHIDPIRESMDDGDRIGAVGESNNNEITRKPWNVTHRPL